jgi:hypothetical protein
MNKQEYGRALVVAGLTPEVGNGLADMAAKRFVVGLKKYGEFGYKDHNVAEMIREEIADIVNYTMFYSKKVELSSDALEIKDVLSLAQAMWSLVGSLEKKYGG